MSQFMVLGDPHARLQDVEKACQVASAQGIDYIIQPGDWMFLNYEGHLQELHDILNRYATRMDFLDGNHDNFGALAAAGCIPSNTEPTILTSRIRYLPRGYVWDFDGLRCMALGGASSVNRPDLVAGVSWWPEELLTIGDVDRAVAQGPVDVLFSHDAPNNLKLAKLLDESAADWSDTEINISSFNRLLIEEVVDAVQPAVNIHGHYHYRYADLYKDTVVFGLDKASRGVASMLVLDTETLLEEVAVIRERLRGPA